jgi:hypothetical protein
LRFIDPGIIHSPPPPVQNRHHVGKVCKHYFPSTFHVQLDENRFQQSGHKWAIAFHERVDRLRKAHFTDILFKARTKVNNNLSLSLTKRRDLRIDARLEVYRHAFSIWKLDRVQQ